MATFSRRGFVLLVAGVLALGALSSARAARDSEGGSLGPGDSAFWNGNERSRSFPLRLEGHGYRLRVAVDDLDYDIFSAYRVEVVDPRGQVAAQGPIEVFVPHPRPGRWTVKVTPTSDSAGRFRVRAKLEELPRATKPRLLKPNLRPEPAYDFTFSYAGRVCTAYTGEDACEGTVPIPLGPSCAADETAEDQAARCLRFSFGYQNAGDGPMDLHFDTLDPVTGTVDVRQRIYYSNRSEGYEDNDHIEDEAGTASYHKTHTHYHYENVFGARLFRVDPKTRATEPLAEVAKKGACAHDYVFVDFERFYQDRQGLADSGNDCSFLFTDPNEPGRIGLSTGWADIYTAELSDNYVDFGVNLDGYYLVRVWSDVDDTIEETNERDNVAYSYIKVSGFEVEVLERGRGRDPWDPARVELEGLGR